MTLEIGQIIDAKYRVVRRIGEGGMGTVYEGENSRIGRRVAIKVLHAQVAAMPDFVERFEREARAAARIGSPYVCDVLDLGDLPGGDRYIVMEYLDGTSFEDRLAEREKLTTSQLAPIAFELLEGLATMHDARVIHRDLKPANIFLAKSGGGRGEKVKILDFGVAKLQPFGGEVGTMTQTGTMMGTPLYMSPEQARGARDVDGRTDIYAASVMFYRALTGALPYNADTLNELLFKIVLEDPKPLRELAPEVDETFAALVHKGLARDLNQRFESARAYREAIASWGRLQGRASLSFAETLPSEPPPPPNTTSGASGAPATPATPQTPVGNVRGGGVVGVAAAVTGASAGTPLAWAESGGSDRPANSSRQAAATVLTALAEGEQRAGAPSTPPSPAELASQGSSASGSATSTVASGRTPARVAPSTSSGTTSDAAMKAAPSASSDGDLASTGPTAKRDGDETGTAEIATATTTPGAPVADVVKNTTAAAAAPGAEARSRRNAVFGAVGAAAVAVVALVAFGRGDGNRPAPTGLTAVPTAASSAEAAQSQILPAAPVATTTSAMGSSTAAVALGADAGAAGQAPAPASAEAQAPGATAATAPGRRDALPAGGTTAGNPPRTDLPRPGTTTNPTTGATGSHAVVASGAATATTATAPAASTTTPKPASSARKFRTNID